MEQQIPARFCELNPNEVKMLTIVGTTITAHLKSGKIFEETFSDRAELSEALRVWALRGETADDASTATPVAGPAS